MYSSKNRRDADDHECINDKAAREKRSNSINRMITTKLRLIYLTVYPRRQDCGCVPTWIYEETNLPYSLHSLIDFCLHSSKFTPLVGSFEVHLHQNSSTAEVFVMTSRPFPCLFNCPQTFQPSPTLHITSCASSNKTIVIKHEQVEIAKIS